MASAIVCASMLRLAKTASFRLSVLFAVIFAGCFAALLLITYLTATSTMREQARRSVEDDSRALLAEVESDGVASIASDINERLQTDAGPTGYYYLADSRGKKLAGNLAAMTAFDGWRETGFDTADRLTLGLTDDDDHQLWGLGTRLKEGAFLFVGQDAMPIISAQEAIIQSFAISIVFALLVAVIAGVIASRGFLSQIDAINKTSSAIMQGRLRERIPIRGTADEMDSLSANLNKLFDSNQSLLESLKQVTTNIAHDLRSPLSRLRQNLEASRVAPGTKKSYEVAIDAAIGQADQLLAIFSGLLRIAQIESGSRMAGFRPVELSELVERVANAYRPVAEDQGKELAASIAPGVHIHGDAELLLQMLANLLENAIRHTPAKTRITMDLIAGSDGPITEITDSGPGIPANERARVFERFYRLDVSRASPGHGLGLSLAAAVATLHGVQIVLEDNRPGLKAIVRFRRAPPEA